MLLSIIAHLFKVSLHALNSCTDTNGNDFVLVYVYELLLTIHYSLKFVFEKCNDMYLNKFNFFGKPQQMRNLLILVSILFVLNENTNQCD